MSGLGISIQEDRLSLGSVAAGIAADALCAACSHHGSATLVVATGSSQFEVLAALSTAPAVPWNRVTVFHLDEYVGLGWRIDAGTAANTTLPSRDRPRGREPSAAGRCRHREVAGICSLSTFNSTATRSRCRAIGG